MKRVLWFGFYRRKVMRTRVLLEGLTKIGVKVEECCVDVREKGRFGKFIALWKSARALGLQKYDAVVVGFPAHQVTWLAKLLFRYPVVCDIGFSTWQSATEDRAYLSKWHPRALWLFLMDFISLHLADHILIDTKAHANYLSRLYGVRSKKFLYAPIGADDEVFVPGPKRKEDKRFVILFHGTFIPLHGLETVIEAAEILKEEEDIAFRLVGDGQTAPQIRKMVLEKGLSNVRFVGRLPMESLSERTVLDELHEADLVLGIFGTGSKPDIQVPTKVFEAMAVGKPVLTGHTQAVKEVMRCDEDVLCSTPGEGVALAEAIIRIKNDPLLLEQIATQGHAAFRLYYSPKKVAEQFLDSLVIVLESD